jgi:hypothetical protein
MPPSGDRLYALAEYTVEHKNDGWYFGRTSRYGDKDERKEPCGSIAPVTVAIARHLKRTPLRPDMAPVSIVIDGKCCHRQWETDPVGNSNLTHPVKVVPPRGRGRCSRRRRGWSWLF